MIRRWGSKHLGNIEQLLRGMSGARLQRVCHEANTWSQVDAGVDHYFMIDRNNECGGEQLGDYV